MYVQKNTTANTKAEILSELEALVGLMNAQPAETIVQNNNDISVVIPFGPSDDETKLLYLIRSIQSSLVDSHKIVIVGAKPTIHLDVQLIEHELKSSNAELNLVHAIQAACLSELVSNKFIVAPLNTYFISLVELADIALLKSAKPRILSISDETAYSNTLRLLSDKGIEHARNFACLLPFVLEKEKFAGLFTEFPELDAIPTFIESIYFNHYYANHSSFELDFARDNIQLNLISPDPNVEKVKTLIANKKFVTLWESAAGDFSENYLNVKFAEKCNLELD